MPATRPAVARLLGCGRSPPGRGRQNRGGQPWRHHCGHRLLRRRQHRDRRVGPDRPVAASPSAPITAGRGGRVSSAPTWWSMPSAVRTAGGMRSTLLISREPGSRWRLSLRTRRAGRHRARVSKWQRWSAAVGDGAWV